MVEFYKSSVEGVDVAGKRPLHEPLQPPQPPSDLPASGAGLGKMVE
jgi:hypothetical protein